MGPAHMAGTIPEQSRGTVAAPRRLWLPPGRARFWIPLGADLRPQRRPGTPCSIAWRFPSAIAANTVDRRCLHAPPPKLTGGQAASTVSAMALRPDFRLGRRISSPILIEDRIAAVRPSNAAEESSRVASRREYRSALR